jgi:hypothetical protein
MVTLLARRETGYFDFENGYVTEKNIWDQICLAYKVDKMIYVPKVDDTLIDQYNTIEEALAAVDGIKVFVEKKNRIEEVGRTPVFLEKFQHPTDAVYIFGDTPTDNSDWITKNDLVLSIDTPHDAHMFGISVAPIILEDRRAKNGT